MEASSAATILSMNLSLLFAAAVAALVCALLAAIVPWLRRRRILDTPNARSSHTVPTPRGGGIAVMAVLLPALLAWMVWAGLPAAEPVAVVGGAAVLAFVSLVDDVVGLGPLFRFGAQLVVIGSIVVFVLAAIGGAAPWLIIVVALALPTWIWFVNLYNFMDGIDGITGVETLVCACGAALVAASVPGASYLAAPALLIAGAALGFLVWNWHPARVFLGDVGSVPLGFLLGWLLLSLAGAGAWAAAIILPSYYLADATLTLLKRLLRGEKVWRAHKEHFYQRAVQAGRSHARVSIAVGLAGLALAGLAWWTTTGYVWEGLGGAAVVVVLLMAWMYPRRIEPAETGT